MGDVFFFLIPVALVVGAFAYVIVATMARARVRELEIRERIAMIERGLVPPPEVDPRGFDRAMDRYERRSRREYARGSGRYRRSGVMAMGVGFGLMLMLGLLTGESSVGLGVGGFLVMIGLAFFINSFFERTEFDATPAYSPPRPDEPPAPTSTAAPPDAPRQT
jgi:hypothetical protein